MLNSKCVFQRLVMEQVFYPDGIYTAKADNELKKEIQLSMDAGFNGARLEGNIQKYSGQPVLICKCGGFICGTGEKRFLYILPNLKFDILRIKRVNEQVDEIKKTEIF